MNHPNPNTSTTFTNITNWKNQEKMGNDEHNIILHHEPHQFPMGSGTWPNPLHTQSSSNVALLTDMLGDQFEEDGEEELGAMKEMMYKMAAMQPVEIDPASIRKPKRRNVRISDDPQSVAARHRRERISEKIGILQRLVPGGTKMDTAAMLDEAIRYVKFLKRQIRLLQSAPLSQPPPPLPINCIAAPPPNNINNGASFLLHTTGGDWPIAPNVLHGSTTTSASSSVEMMAGVEFNTSGHVHALDASSSFNNHEVIN